MDKSGTRPRQVADAFGVPYRGSTRKTLGLDPETNPLGGERQLSRRTGRDCDPHGPSMDMARAYAGGTPGWSGSSDMQPIVVNVDGQKLFEIVKKRSYGYAVNNGNRSRSGHVSGTLVPRPLR